MIIQIILIIMKSERINKKMLTLNILQATFQILTVTQLFVQRAQMQTPYPLGLGGTSDSFEYSVLDVNQGETKMVVAGECQDSSLCGSKDSIFVELYVISTRTIDWTKYITHQTDSNLEPQDAQAIKFGSSGTTIYIGIIMKSNYKPMIAKLAEPVGALIRVYYLSYSFYWSSSISDKFINSAFLVHQDDCLTFIVQPTSMSQRLFRIQIVSEIATQSSLLGTMNSIDIKVQGLITDGTSGSNTGFFLSGVQAASSNNQIFVTYIKNNFDINWEIFSQSNKGTAYSDE